MYPSPLTRNTGPVVPDGANSSAVGADINMNSNLTPMLTSTRYPVHALKFKNKTKNTRLFWMRASCKTRCEMIDRCAILEEAYDTEDVR